MEILKEKQGEKMVGISSFLFSRTAKLLRRLQLSFRLTSICITVSDWEYQEWLDRFEIPKLCSKTTFREPLSKILFRVSKNFKSSRNLQKNDYIAFCLIKYAKNIRKIDKVLGIRIQTIYKTRTRGKLRMRALPFFYLTIVNWKVSATVEFSNLYENGENCVVLRA